MSKETIWLIIAGLAALAAVPLIYMGLQSGSAMLTVGFALFAGSMLITPVMRVCAKPAA